MTEYHKIQTVWLRDPATRHKYLLEGEWAKPEFEYLADAGWVFTEKVDGTNIRLRWDRTDGVLAVRGKTDAAQLPSPIAAMRDGLQERFRSAELPSMTVYAEGFGPKIQSGKAYREDHGLAVFDVRCGGNWLERANVEDIAGKLDLEVAPVVGVGTLAGAIKMAREGFASAWGTARSEGIVARPAVELLNRRGERVITKVKWKDFPR